GERLHGQPPLNARSHTIEYQKERCSGSSAGYSPRRLVVTVPRMSVLGLSGSKTLSTLCERPSTLATQVEPHRCVPARRMRMSWDATGAKLGAFLSRVSWPRLAESRTLGKRDQPPARRRSHDHRRRRVGVRLRPRRPGL